MKGVYSAADRGFQRFYKAVEPTGDVKDDWVIISEIATAMGYPMHYNNTKEIWDELRDLCPLYKGQLTKKMEGMGYIQWPCTDEGPEDQGTQYLYKGQIFDRPNGKLNSLHATGNHRWKIFQKNSHWYFLPYVKWVTTPAVL